VTTKVFVNWDKQEKQEANRKVKRKVYLLAVAPAEQLGWLLCAGHDKERENPHGWWSVPTEWYHPREQLRQD
jgi:hypothetical protein